MRAARVIDHPVLTAKLSILRAKTTAPEEFRRNIQEIAMLMLCEAGRAWNEVADRARDAAEKMRRSHLKKHCGQ
ncbi:MAG: hypothetical protein DME49_12260 [Verrucomicrobia bacterium]|nr:MAG: hypothetical protein DME49_12260 [Verrucomicrobiota bacterium]